MRVDLLQFGEWHIQMYAVSPHTPVATIQEWYVFMLCEYEMSHLLQKLDNQGDNLRNLGDVLISKSDFESTDLEPLACLVCYVLLSPVRFHSK